MLDKTAVARALREIGMLLELEGENPFKVRAYENGARAVEALDEDLGALVAGERLEELPGVGEALARKIAELHRTGRLPLLDDLRARHPPGVLELLQVPDLGPKKIAALHAALGIASVADLRAACEAGRVRGVKGFGERTERKILEGILRLADRPARRVLLADALATGERLLAHLRRSPAALRCELAGSARRGRETVGDLDLVAASREPAALVDHFLALPSIEETLARGDTKTSVRLSGGLQVDLRVVPEEDFATLLHHLTGAKGHHVRLRGVAREKGYTLSEWGLYRLPTPASSVPSPLIPSPSTSNPSDSARPERRPREARPESKDAQGERSRGTTPTATAPLPRDGPPPGSEKVPIASEAALYAALGMQEVPPELREDQGEIEAALAGNLPRDLVALEDVRGMVHCHTTWSDGRATVLEMARAAEAMGMAYLTITDHSGSASYAGGLDRDRLLRQWEELDRVQEQTRVVLLRGTEADILEDGALDWPADVLERLDVVVASIHSRMRMDEDAMTRRLVAAMRQPVFKIWGHPLGRLLGKREPFAARVEEVLDALAASRGAVEVNGDPERLEADPRLLRLAKARGIPVVLSVDAHSTAALGYLRLAVATARRGWVTRGEVLNARSADAFRAAVRPVG